MAKLQEILQWVKLHLSHIFNSNKSILIELIKLKSQNHAKNPHLEHWEMTVIEKWKMLYRKPVNYLLNVQSWMELRWDAKIVLPLILTLSSQSPHSKTDRSVQSTLEPSPSLPTAVTLTSRLQSGSRATEVVGSFLWSLVSLFFSEATRLII